MALVRPLKTRMRPSTGLTDEIAAADYLKRKTDKDMRRNKLVRICRNLASLAAGHNG